jgi:hypothetical protein
MMSLESIRAETRKVTKQASRLYFQPYVPLHEDEIKTYPPFPFPNLGDHRPKGWELVDTLFVDSSGWGADDEPAMSVRQLVKKLIELQRSDKTYGYGIVEEGQFQLHLGVFERRKHSSLGDKSAND